MRTPIIMEDSIEKVEDKVVILKNRNEKKVQFDVGDGMYSDWIGVSPADIARIDLSSFEVEVHLLVDDPVEWIPESLLVAPKRIIGQIERMGSQMFFLDEVEKVGVSGGLALAINTPVSAIEKDALKIAKVILLLAVPAGTSGSSFDDKVIKKIKELRMIYDGEIMIDGGINKQTEQDVLLAGASSVAVNSAYWRGEFN